MVHGWRQVYFQLLPSPKLYHSKLKIKVLTKANSIYLNKILVGPRMPETYFPIPLYRSFVSVLHFCYCFIPPSQTPSMGLFFKYTQDTMTVLFRWSDKNVVAKLFAAILLLLYRGYTLSDSRECFTVVQRMEGSLSNSNSSSAGNVDRLKILYPFVNEEETPLPRSWSPKDKFTFIGLSQNNLRVHYKGIYLNLVSQS